MWYNACAIAYLQSMSFLDVICRVHYLNLSCHLYCGQSISLKPICNQWTGLVDWCKKLTSEQRNTVSSCGLVSSQSNKQWSTVQHEGKCLPPVFKCTTYMKIISTQCHFHHWKFSCYVCSIICLLETAYSIFCVCTTLHLKTSPSTWPTLHSRSDTLWWTLVSGWFKWENNWEIIPYFVLHYQQLLHF